MILISIGTKPSNRLVYSSSNPKFKYISGHHAELILKDDGSIYLVDKGSTNGTKLNGRKIEPEVEVPVNRGDKITFADVVDLDWAKIPIIPAIDPRAWDVYSIGTNLNNRIQLNDASNMVSRFHATIKINKKNGKIFIIDSSANGTFVKGQRIPANQEVLIKWKEQVTFANNIPLDWSKLKKPNPIPLKQILTVAASIAAVLIIAIGVWQWDSIKRFIGNKPSWEDYQTATVLIYNAYYYDVIFDDEIFDKISFGVVHSKDGTKYDFFPAESNEKVRPLASLGTGFFISNDGKIVTNKHVVEPWEFIDKVDKDKLMHTVSKLLNDYQSTLYSEFVKIANRQNINDIQAVLRRISNLHVKEITGKSITLRIGFYDRYYESLDKFEPCRMLKASDNKDIDLAIIQINEKNLPARVKAIVDVSKIELSDKNLKIGEKLTTIGYPTGLAINYRPDEGGLKPIMKSGDLQRDPSSINFDIDVELLGGASGSPVFNSERELVGVVNSSFSNSSTFGKGILAKHIKKLLDETN